MKTTTMLLLSMIAPAALLAQGSVTAKSRTTATANARVPDDFSARGRVRLEATYARSREHHLPEAAIEHRVDEGEAKGASEAAIVASAARVEAHMEAAEEAMVKAGRHPSDKEVESGAYAMERGATKAQIETMAQHAPQGRSLTVAFDVLTKLSDNGVPITNALLQVQSKLDAHASDAAITSLVTANGKAGLKLGGRGGL